MFFFVWLNLEAKCYPQNPKVIPTSTFLRLFFLLGLTNNHNSFLSFRYLASRATGSPVATVGGYVAECPHFHCGVVSLSRHRNEGNFAHMLEYMLQPRSHGRVVLSVMRLHATDQCQHPIPEIHGPPLTPGCVMHLSGRVMLVLSVTQPTQHNTRCW